ncbi:DMT family transporter [Bosea caraganae]|uniref:DMT family transporter n=1 Tax=Bosea caraganae TaxID=2763117 RepID=UPI0015F07C56|nr:DMT family transporter [Bosea caraganae]
MTIAPEKAFPAEPSRAFIVGNLLACSFFWGCSFLFIKLMNGEVAPLAVAAGRGLFGAGTLALWVIWLGQKPWPRRHELRHWLVLGTTNGWVPNVLVAYALTQLASGPAAIQAAGPLVTAVFAHVLFAEERLSGRRIVGVLLGMAGVALLIGPRLVEGGGTALGVLAMAGVTLGYAIGNLYTRAVPAPAGDPARLALGQQMVSGLAALGLTLAFLGPSALVPIQNHVPAMLALGLAATAVPMAIFMKLIRRAGPTRAAMTGYLVPAVATIMVVLVLDERLELRQAIGGCIVLAGVYLVSTSRMGRGAA